MIILLDRELSFPDPMSADADGLVAIGGDLTIERLLLAYSSGIFPWYMGRDPILWWSPDPRAILFPQDLKISKSLRKKLRENSYNVRVDNCFETVMLHCAHAGTRQQEGTWITNEMIRAYVNLHESGYAHSFETYRDGELIGGLYGVSIGKMFAGESMFALENDASKVALVYLCSLLISFGFDFIDVQQDNDHLLSLGAVRLSRRGFLEILRPATTKKGFRGKWTTYGENNDFLKVK